MSPEGGDADEFEEFDMAISDVSRLKEALSDTSSLSLLRTRRAEGHMHSSRP